MKTSISKLVLFCFLIPLFVVSCGKLPGETELGQDLAIAIQKAKVRSESGFGQKVTDFYKLTEYRKTNGLKGGEGRYKVEFNGTIEFIQKTYAYINPYAGVLYYSTKDLGKRRKTRIFNKGEAVMFSGSATYEKTEKGWRHRSHAIRMATKFAAPF